MGCVSSFAAFCRSIKHADNLSSYSLFVIVALFALLTHICTPKLIAVSVMSDKASILAMLHEKFTFHGTEWQFYQRLHHEIQIQNDLSWMNLILQKSCCY